jgi:hypothetical protein
MESRPTADRVVGACPKPYLWQDRLRLLDKAGKAPIPRLQAEGSSLSESTLRSVKDSGFKIMGTSFSGSAKI